MTAEERFAQAWVANSCGDEKCQERRLQAALNVLAGRQTHQDLAKHVEEAMIEIADRAKGTKRHE